MQLETTCIMVLFLLLIINEAKFLIVSLIILVIFIWDVMITWFTLDLSLLLSISFPTWKSIFISHRIMIIILWSDYFIKFLVFAAIVWCLNLLSANPTKCSNTLKQFIGNLPTNCLSVFDHFVGLALQGLS